MPTNLQPWSKPPNSLRRPAATTTGRVLRFRLRQRGPVISPQEKPPAPVKCAVFDNRPLLRCMACAAAEQVRCGRLGGLPLLVPPEVRDKHPDSLAAVVPVRRPRSSDVVFCAARPAVTQTARPNDPPSRVARYQAVVRTGPAAKLLTACQLTRSESFCRGRKRVRIFPMGV